MTMIREYGVHTSTYIGLIDVFRELYICDMRLPVPLNSTAMSRDRQRNVRGGMPLVMANSLMPQQTKR